MNTRFEVFVIETKGVFYYEHEIQILRRRNLEVHSIKPELVFYSEHEIQSLYPKNLGFHSTKSEVVLYYKYENQKSFREGEIGKGDKRHRFKPHKKNR